MVITTKDRKDDLRKAVASAVAQTARTEVIVIDDGSSDGTSDMIRAEFPTVRVERSEVSRGYIVHRNRGAELARAPVIFSIDDDAIMVSRETIAHTLREFSHPRIGAVAIPFMNVLTSRDLLTSAPDGSRVWVGAYYIGCSHAVRRDLFLSLGGYRTHFIHQGEEGDYCQRMLDRGYVVRLGTAPAIEHHESPKRNLVRQYTLTSRTNVLNPWLNVPMPDWVPFTILQSAKTFAVLGVRRKYPWTVLKGLARGYGAIFTHWSLRKPMKVKAFRLWKRLWNEKALPFDEVEPLLGPMVSPTIAPSRSGADAGVGG